MKFNILIVAAFLLTGCEDWVAADAMCPKTNEHSALESCAVEWSCDKTPQDIERMLDLEDTRDECLTKAYEQLKEKALDE